jgi:hypothetical protein
MDAERVLIALPLRNDLENAPGAREPCALQA